MNWKRVLRVMLYVVAIGLAGGGFYVMLSPGVAPGLPLSLGFVTIVSIMALGFGLWIARTRWSGGVLRQTSTPNPEQPLATSPPGEDVDEMLHNLMTYREGTIEYREQIRDRVASVAVEAIRFREECSESEAVAMLEEGSWTDDPVAAGFFTGHDAVAGESVVQEVVGMFTESEQMGYDEVLQATIDEIARVAGVEPPEREAEDGSLLSRLLGGRGEEDPTEYYDSVIERDTVGQQVSEQCTIYDEFRTNHWLGAAAFSLVAIAAGAFTFQPALLLVGALGAGYSAYSRIGGVPAVENLSVTRDLTNETPQPGEEVTVRVTVTNEGDSFMSDLRLIDRIPPTMRVTDGSPRVNTTLRSGASVTFEYTLLAERGVHEWPLLVIGRSISGGTETEAEITTDAEMQCMPGLVTAAESPVRQQTSLYSGDVDTETPGSGLEFYSIRQYAHGDPMRRINWKELAKTGDLSTIEFRQELAASVLLLFDARSSAYVSPTPDRRHAVDLSVDAANDVFASLADSGNLVGVAAFDTVPCWLGPSAGDDHQERARRIFAEHPAISALPPEHKDVRGQYIDPFTHIQRRMQPGTQVIMFSPLGDDYTLSVATRLDSAGHRVTVISPDPTNDETIGQLLARVERRMRINNLRKRDVRVIDWSPDEPLYLEFERAIQRNLA